jgi:hypothetical protein
MIKVSMVVPIFTVPMVPLFGQNAYGQQGPYSKVVKELQQLTETAADLMATSAMM